MTHGPGDGSHPFEELYPSDDWVIVSVGSSMIRRLSTGDAVRIPTPAMFWVCKVAASRNPKRWAGPYGSHDLEDIAALMAGCSELGQSVSTLGQAAANFLSAWAAEVLGGTSAYGRQAHACLEGNWPRQARLDTLEELLRAVAASGKA